MAEEKKKETTKSKAAEDKVKAAPKKKVAAPKKTTESSSVETPSKKSASQDLTSKNSHHSSFKNDLVSIKLTQHPGCTVEIEAELASKVLDDAYAQALKEVSKGVSIPGFRKGKVPKQIIEKNYHASILQEQSYILLQKGLDLSLDLTKIRPLNHRNIKPKVVKQNSSEAIFSYSFESYPEVPHIPTEKIKLDLVKQEEISEERINEIIDVMRSYVAKWESIEDRAVEQGDYVDVDIINLENDTKLVSKKRVQVEPGKVSKWLYDLIVGMKKDESQEGLSKWDDSLPASEKKEFQSTQCKVTVLGIFKGDLPPVDEDFAQSMGTQSVAELRTQVLLRLTKNAEMAYENQQKVLLDKALEKLVEFDLPQSLLDAEMQTKLKLKQKLGTKTASKQDEKEALQEAKESLKLFFILQKLANDHNILVSEQELRENLSQRLSHINLPKELLNNQKYKNQLIQEMRMNSFIDILTEKVRHHLLKHVIVDSDS